MEPIAAKPIHSFNSQFDERDFNDAVDKVVAYIRANPNKTRAMVLAIARNLSQEN